MSWQGQMSTIVRHLVDDLDATKYKYSPNRIETAILVSAQLTIMNVDFNNEYSINVEGCTLSPDPTDERRSIHCLDFLKNCYHYCWE
jgi:hypothetical protein